MGEEERLDFLQDLHFYEFTSKKLEVEIKHKGRLYYLSVARKG
jgi:hypothetical protein